MLLASLLALAGMAGYQYSKAKHKNKNNNTTNTTTTNTEKEDANKAQNVYNYYTNDSTTGNTLFNSQQKTKRAIFGGEV